MEKSASVRPKSTIWWWLGFYILLAGAFSLHMLCQPLVNLDRSLSLLLLDRQLGPTALRSSSHLNTQKKNERDICLSLNIITAQQPLKHHSHLPCIISSFRLWKMGRLSLREMRSWRAQSSRRKIKSQHPVLIIKSITFFYIAVK